MTITESQKSRINRRDILKKSAAAGAVFWAVPVIESVTSQAAAASGGLTCGATWIYYQHSSSQVCLIGFTQGSLGQGPTCIGPPFTGTIAPCPASQFTSLQGNHFTISPIVNPGTGGPTANATITVSPNGPASPSPITNPSPCSNGACTGFFTISGNTVSAGSSNVILAAYSVPVSGCSASPWSSPSNPLTVNNSITLGVC